MLQKSKILILIILIVTGCGTRKRIMHKKTVDIKEVEQKKMINTEEALHVINTNLFANIDKVSFEPVDKNKPMILGGREFENVIIHKEKINKIDTSKTIKKEKKVQLDLSKSETTIHKTDKKNQVERDNSFGFFDWFWLILAVVSVIILYKKRYKILQIFRNINS